MVYKDLVVLLDAEPASRGRIELAATMADRSGAHLVGLYTEIALELPRWLGYFDPGLLDPLYREVETASRERTQEMRIIFEDIASRHGLSAEWRFANGDPSRRVGCEPRSNSRGQ